VAPVPPFVDVTGVVVLSNVPAIVGVILTLTVQVAEMVPLLNVNAISPAVGANVGEPHPAEAVAFGGFATCRPEGRLSENDTPVSATGLPAGAVSTNVAVLVLPTDAVIGAKDLLITGGEITARVADAVLPLPPFVDVTAPLVLFLFPLVVPSTVTVTVQLLLGRILPPLNVTDVAVFVTVPPHCAESGAMATLIPLGKLSLKSTPVNGTVLVGGFVIVKVRMDVFPTGMAAGENDLLMEGATTA